MKYFYSKYKFTSDLFYKKIEKATVDTYKDCFVVKIFPFFQYSGHFFIHSIISENQKKIVYRTMLQKSDSENVDFDLINPYNEFFIGFCSHSKKISIFQSNLDGIILKT